MAIFIINYDFKSEAKREAVRDLPGAKKIAESAYALDRNKTTSQVDKEARAAIRAAVKAATGEDPGERPFSPGDRLWVVPVTAEIVGCGPKDLVKWFTDRGV